MNARVHHTPLDELRGLAVLVVFVSHAANDGMLPSALGSGAGQMGVQVFFLLSGYLMMRLYGATPPSPHTLKRFAMARAGRILPLYAAVVLSAGAGGLMQWPAHYDLTSAGSFWSAILFLGAPQELWSIPVEVQFYMLFAALWANGGLSGKRLAVAIPVAFALAVIWRGFVSDAAILLPFLPVFLIGCLIAQMPVIGFLGRGAWPAIVLVFFVLNLPGLRSPVGMEVFDGFYPTLWLDPVRLVAVIFLLLSAIAAQDRWLLGAPLAALGRVSFCVYLLHRPLIRIWTEGAGLPATPVGAVAVLGLTWIVAILSLTHFERPAANLLRAALAGRPRPAPQPEKG